MILPEGEHLDSWDCFTHGILSYWKSTATLLLCHSVGRLLFCPSWQSHLIFCGLWSFAACLGTAWHSLLSFILSSCWLCDTVLLKSWPFTWLSGITSWPANCLTLTTYCPVHLLNGMYRLLIVLSIWLHMGIGLLLPCLMLWVPGHHLPAERICWLCGIALLLLGTPADCLVLLYQLAECVAFSSCLFT